MAHNYIDSPRTELDTRMNDTTFHGNLDFSEEASFRAPEDGDNLFNPTNNSRGGALATPRNPLAQMRNTNARNEFTPMLRSAVANRTRQMGKGMDPGLKTPLGLKAGYEVSGTPLPEASIYSGMSETSMSEATPVPNVGDSSDVSTPMGLKRNGGNDAPLESGNVLTLREQEARLEQIDKENFGLKLKIHFLQETLRKAGPEFNNAALAENVHLKTEKLLMDRDIKLYTKQLKQAEKELETYRTQLREYAEKVKRRHMDESIKEEMEELRALAEERKAEIEVRERAGEGAG